MSPDEHRVGLFRIDQEGEVVAKTIKLSHAILLLVIALFSVGAGLAMTLVTGGELRLKSVAEQEVSKQTNGYANRLIVLEAAVANSVTREDLARQEERDREWRGEILKSINDLRVEIRSWHNANTTGNAGRER